MNIFKRLLTIGKAEIHSVIDSFEDPINTTEQGIREMKEQLGKSIEALAQLKALDIRKKMKLKLRSRLPKTIIIRLSSSYRKRKKEKWKLQKQTALPKKP